MLLLLFLLVLLLTLFPNSAYEMQTKWEVKRGATVRFPDISSRFAKCCTYLDPHFDMVHLFHPTFPNGAYEMQTKWEVNRGATFCFPDTSSRFAKCCTNLYLHFDMVHFFHPTFANGDSYIFNLVTCIHSAFLFSIFLYDTNLCLTPNLNLSPTPNFHLTPTPTLICPPPQP